MFLILCEWTMSVIRKLRKLKSLSALQIPLNHFFLRSLVFLLLLHCSETLETVLDIVNKCFDGILAQHHPGHFTAENGDLFEERVTRGEISEDVSDEF